MTAPLTSQEHIDHATARLASVVEDSEGHLGYDHRIAIAQVHATLAVAAAIQAAAPPLQTISATDAPNLAKRAIADALAEAETRRTQEPLA